MRFTLPAQLVIVAALAVSATAGCNSTAEEPPKARVVVSLYPLAWAAERVGGDGVEVVNLTPPGAEPHDIELSARDVEAVRDADLVVYGSYPGFQPAVLDAVAQRRGISVDAHGLDRDPHVWLDPVRFASLVEAIGEALGRSEAAAELASELARVDREYREGLTSCERRTLVTTHAAFRLLAERYGLAELSLAGRSPEAEPSPRELERLIQDVKRSGATTVFAEPLVSDRLAKTVAREAGVDRAVLDPIEGLSEERLKAGEDYLSVMRTNLETLRKALGCT